MGEALFSGDVQFSATRPAPAYGAAAGDPGRPADVSFHEVLSVLNPLQYLPVVGTIYRAVTGDTIPEPLRNMGSMLASGLIGGPVGLLTNVASLVFQKVTGIDLDAVGQSVLHGLGIGEGTQPALAIAAPPAAAAAPEALPAPARVAWTSNQLSAYGMAEQTGQTVTADTLNGLEMMDIGRALAAYGKAPA